MNEPRRKWGWGLIGPGRFAREFASELILNDRARPVAVASRDPTRAREFAADFGFEKSHDSYQALVDDPEVEIVYIVVPHVFHRGIAELAMRAGKAVVCEKPLTVNAAETRTLCELARERGVFLMEAMKTAFLPAIQRARQWIAAGEIGDVKLIRADFCFSGPDDPNDRLMNPKLGGGCVLDVGIYPIFLSHFLGGKICDLKTTGHLTETGVEDTVAISLTHENGACSALTASFQSHESMDAVILGTAGSIQIPKFHTAQTAILNRADGRSEMFEAEDSGMVGAEIEAVMGALDAGHLECPGHPHQRSIRLAELMEMAIHQIQSSKP
ncbi:MAG: Gfo/Idh/MocA family oxidoreductase [Verrucomicrobiae bacterium]|nr:Gfo/Idh/MocA family oxidoreductase [Verrucomicrobiae bacterium]